MIIGISGKKQSGKDTVAKMIQDNTSTPFEVRKFADKLKDIVCMIIGCTREQLEDPEFKEKPLGEEWDLWEVKSSYPNKSKLFANESKALEYVIWLNKEIDDLARLYEVRDLTPRLILQLLGTEGGREAVHPNIWVNALMSDYKLGWCEELVGYVSSKVWRLPNWIISDVRFPNEVEAIKKQDGVLIRIERESAVGTDSHTSETALDDYKQGWDFVIENNVPLDMLEVVTKNICERIGLSILTIGK